MTESECAAEEGGGGKVILLQRGGYKEMDVCLMFTLPLPSILPADGPGVQVTPGSNATPVGNHWDFIGQTRHHRQIPWSQVRYLLRGVLPVTAFLMS